MLNIIYNILLTCTSVMSMSMSILVIFIALKRSPTGMHTYTPYIVNFTICDLLVSVTYGILVRPREIYPYDCISINGLVKYLPAYSGFVSTMLMLSGLVLCISAQCHCIIYRVLVLLDDKRLFVLFKSKKNWILTYTSNFTYCIFISLMLFKVQLKPDDIPQIKNLQLSQISLIDPKLPHLCIDRSNPNITLLSKLGIAGYAFVEVLSFICVFSIFRILNVKRAAFSKLTYKMHTQLGIALGAQIMAPVLFVMLPVMSVVYCGYMGWTLSDLNGQIVILAIDCYGGISSCLTLYLIKPYRRFVYDHVFRAISYVAHGSERGDSSVWAIKLNNTGITQQ
ncbi:unnamed protein product [Bursaphelenchus okinawaensis]|uniref:G_PROTEIN_RECEP_F1_2 domain-containing protein n=1 Tax=Bursaphelenchus okinawaensis TaxID=465554 RepID=A0A811KE87_9BILA|nr:unnamed protein product [Bursaphelenchus okinawaensis]CAG9102844.1 unnamed protein product [Bursaphelenchus okinawaensis]